MKQEPDGHTSEPSRQPPSGGCVLKQADKRSAGLFAAPAAFRRLCVETTPSIPNPYLSQNQPPSGGCVLKQGKFADESQQMSQPPSGGCVLKHAWAHPSVLERRQPPSGGCVLKRSSNRLSVSSSSPAAFRRLCVETKGIFEFWNGSKPAAFRRLCVETSCA